MSRRDALLAASVASIWGFNFVVIDWGMAAGESPVPPLLFAALRFSLVVFPAVLFVPRPNLSWRAVSAVGATMSLGQFGFLYTSIHAGMPPGLAALVLQAQIVFTILIAAGWLREAPTFPQVIGVILGVLGLALVAIGRGGNVPLGALALCVLAALSWGLGNVISRVVSRQSGPLSAPMAGLSLTVWSALVVPVPLVVLGLTLDGPSAMASALIEISWQAMLSTLYTAGLASLFGYAVFNGLLSRYPSAMVVPWILLAPLVAMGSAWALLGQRPNAAESLGGVLMLSGMAVATLVRPGMVRPDDQAVPLPVPPPITADRAASSRATGTRKGEQDT